VRLDLHRVEQLVDGLGQGEFPVAEDALRAEDHDEHQRHRVHEHAVGGEGAQQLRQDRQRDGGDDGTCQRAHAAEHDHDHVVDRLQPSGHRGVQRADVLGEDAAGDAREERGDSEHEHLHVGDVDAGRACRDLVVADGLDGTAVTGAGEHEQQHDGDDGDPEHDVQVGGAFDADQRLSGGALVEAHAAGDLQVLDDHADDFAEAQRDDGEVIAMQTQCRNADQDAEDAGDHAAGERRQQESQRRIHRNAVGDEQLAQQGRAVRADRFEAAAAQRQLAEHADGEVQRGGHDDGDAACHHDALDVGAGHAGFAYTHQNAEQHDDADRAHQIGLFGGKH